MVQQKNIVVCILLSFVTCGIYGIYWFICLNNDANTVSGTDGTSGVMAFIYTLITCGIYHFFWVYKQGEKLDAAKNEKGIPSSNSGILYLILNFLGLGIVAYCLMQDAINKVA